MVQHKQLKNPNQPPHGVLDFPYFYGTVRKVNEHRRGRSQLIPGVTALTGAAGTGMEL